MKRSDRTRLAILDAAEHLFSMHGPDSTSMRQITSLAKVNLSAVNYHFGDKSNLIEEVFQRRLNTLNAERLRLLEQYQQQSPNSPLKASQIVHAFFAPLIRHAFTVDRNRQNKQALLNQNNSDPDSFIRILCTDKRAGIFNIFRQALMAALPGVPEEEMVWRFHFMLGATFYALQGTSSLREALLLPPSEKPETMEMLEARLMSFLLGGLRAPLPADMLTLNT